MASRQQPPIKVDMTIAGGIEGASGFIRVLLISAETTKVRGTLAFGFAAQSGSYEITAADTSDVQHPQHCAMMRCWPPIKSDKQSCPSCKHSFCFESGRLAISHGPARLSHPPRE
jgi:hypothetical protein